MKQRKNIIIFIITMILSVIVLWFFVTGYDSIDTYRIYSQGYIDYATKDAYINITMRDFDFYSCFVKCCYCKTCTNHNTYGND